MRAYFASVPPRDAAWAVYVLSGRRQRRLVGAAELRDWLQRACGYPAWLVEDSYAAVGDLAETIALLMAAAPEHVHGCDAGVDSVSLADWLELRLPSLRDADAESRQQLVTAWWRALDPAQAFLVTKLLTGGLRVGVSRALVARALSGLADVPQATMQHRLMGRWQPTATWFEGLLAAADARAEPSRPYPFFLASPLEADADPSVALGQRGDWLAEWKWDGIRAQCIRRGGECFIWTRGEELVTERYPEVQAALQTLPEGCVLDSELLAWRPGDRQALPFSALQRRIGRLKPGKRLREEVPVRLLAYDLLEFAGADLRAAPLQERRERLAGLLDDAPPALGLSPLLDADDWPSLTEARARSRELGVEGLMLKRHDSPYQVGRARGDWWKWKIEPLTLDAVMIYAQAGHGRRASLYTDYTFAVWQDEDLVPVAKAYSGLADTEIVRLDRWIRKHTLERFGPVRQVEPLQVFELAFEGIAHSARHRSGVALRFPRIRRWREDLGPKDADSLAQVQALLEGQERD